MGRITKTMKYENGYLRLPVAPPHLQQSEAHLKVTSLYSTLYEYRHTRLCVRVCMCVCVHVTLNDGWRRSRDASRRDHLANQGHLDKVT